MKTIFTAVLLALACDSRALPSCTSGTDCSPTEWCVRTWRSPRGNTPANVCAARCSQGSDCASGECAEVGDGATLALDNPSPFACRE